MSELTEAQFNLIAKLIKSRAPAKSGAYLVLVKGKNNPDAYAEAGISPQSLSNTLGRFRRVHKEIEAIY